MGRRSGATAILIALAREAARQQRLAVAEEERRHREAERLQRMRLKEEAASARLALASQREMERLAKARYIENREDEVQELNDQVTETIERLGAVLDDTLSIDDAIDFESLRVHDSPPRLRIPDQLRQAAPYPASRHELIPRPSGLKALLPGATKRYAEMVRTAKESHEREVERWTEEEQQRLQQLTDLELQHAVELAAYEHKRAQRDAEVDEFEQRYRSRDNDAVVSYCSMVLERSSYPEDFPQNFSVAYTSSSKQIVIEYELPQPAIVPNVVEFRYTKTKDQITQRPRKPNELKEIYQDIVAATALRTIHEIFESDQYGHVDVVCFNGFVRTIDPANGKDIAPHLISIRVTKEKFTGIDLARVDKRICLKNLGAQVSRQPEEAVPVKPIVEFDMADARFVDQRNLVSSLSSATNLMDLNPYEFEQLVANLFGQMGLESKLTRSSRDGGVDCIAYDSRPVLGGKVVIQAKRYKHAVGVSAVRDLYGTMINGGANKGILRQTNRID